MPVQTPENPDGSADPAGVRDLFQGIASRYDLANHLLSGGVDFYWRKRLVELADLKPDMALLDVCCGTGDLAFAFARRTPEARIVGCDFSEEMIRLARIKQQNLHETGAVSPEHLSWVVDDCTDMKLDDGQFDMVTCAFGVRNMKLNLQKALRQMHRILRPSGRLFILEFSLPDCFFVRGLYLFYLCLILPVLGGIITGKVASYRYLADTIRDWSKNVDLVDELRNAGFVDIKAVPLTFGIVTLVTAARS